MAVLPGYLPYARLLQICKVDLLDFFARCPHTRTAAMHLPLHQLGFLVHHCLHKFDDGAVIDVENGH